jgi:hypothetical protein
MNFYHWDPNTTYYVDKLNRIVVLDGACRVAPELRQLEGQVVRQSQRVQKMLDLCDCLQEEATGTPGNYINNDAGTRFLDRDTRETCIKILLECNKRAIRELKRIHDDLEKEKDEWVAKSAAKNQAHFPAQARQEAERRAWVDGRNASNGVDVKYFWQ